MGKVLSMLHIRGNLFKQRRLCLLCSQDLSDARLCPLCPTSSETNTAIIYDTDLKFILSSLLKSRWKEIEDYTVQIRTNNDVLGTKDIGYAQCYQHLLDRFSAESFVTALMHLDGVGLCKSSKLKMWLFSFSLVELPPKVRYQRYNMPIMSMWISHKEPVASLWLRRCVSSLEEIKVSGTNVPIDS